MIRTITIIALALTAITALAGPGHYRGEQVGDRFERGPRVHHEVDEREDFDRDFYADEERIEEIAAPGAQCNEGGTTASMLQENVPYGAYVCDILVEMECVKIGGDLYWEITYEDVLDCTPTSALDTDVGYY